MLCRMLSMACCLCLIVRAGAQEPGLEAKKLQELKWARGVAEDFLSALQSNNLGQARLLMAKDLLKQENDRLDKLGPEFADDQRMTSRFTTAEFRVKGTAQILREEIAPDQDEAVFRGELQGQFSEKAKRVRADFALRVVKEKETGTWRVSFLNWTNVRPVPEGKSSPPKDDVKKLPLKDADKKLDLDLPFLEAALAKLKAKLGPDHPETLAAMNKLAAAYLAAQKIDLCVPLYEEVLKLTMARVGRDHPDTLVGKGKLAAAYQMAGKLDLALPLYEEALAKLRAKLGPDHESTLIAMTNLANGYLAVKKIDRAVPLYEQAVAKMQAKLGREYPETVNSMSKLALAWFAAGQTDKARQLCEECLVLQRKVWGEGDPRYTSHLAAYGGALVKSEQYTAAEPMLRKSLEIRLKSQPGAWSTFNSMAQLGGSLLGQKKYAEALPLLKEGYEGMKAREKSIPPAGLIHLTTTLERLIRVHEATGDAASADRYRHELAARKAAEN